MSSVTTIAFGNKHTPHQTLIDAMSHIDGVQTVIVVMLDEDDYVVTSWSDGSMLKRLGMLDMAKLRMIDEGQEDEQD